PRASTTAAAATKTPPPRERVWFIDGGLSSNFPVTLFDSPFPNSPTFCINLSAFHPKHPQDRVDESNNVWMVADNREGISNRWNRLPTSGPARIFGYVAAMLDAIRNWHDNTQLMVPGFRDRIAHVMLSGEEGGLNLDMDPEKVKRLSLRGHFAAVLLRERFGAAGATREVPNWNSHRW